MIEANEVETKLAQINQYIHRGDIRVDTEQKRCLAQLDQTTLELAEQLFSRDLVRYILEQADNQDLAACVKALAVGAEIDQEKITEFRRCIDHPETLHDHPDYLGKGDNAYVFRMQFRGQVAAIKLYKDQMTFAYELDGLSAVPRLPKVNQLLVAIPRHAAIILSFMPGIAMDHLDQPVEYSDVHLMELIETILALVSKRCCLDNGNGGNILYDSNTGLHFVDIQYNKDSGRLSLQLDPLTQLDGALRSLTAYPAMSFGDQLVRAAKLRLRVLQMIQKSFPDLFSSIMTREPPINSRVRDAFGGLRDVESAKWEAEKQGIRWQNLYPDFAHFVQQEIKIQNKA